MSAIKEYGGAVGVGGGAVEGVPLKVYGIALFDGVAARVTNSGAVSINNSTWTVVSFDTTRFDTASLYSVAHPTRLTAPVAGIYQVSANVGFAASTAGTRRNLGLVFNGTTTIAQSTVAPTGTGSLCLLTLTTLWKFGVGDYVECEVFQDTGGALNTVQSPDLSPEFMMVKVG